MTADRDDAFSQTKDHILETRNVSKIYINGIYANNSVNFGLRKGEIHALVGENGAGKTTLMKILYGLETPDEGEILLNGEKVHIASPHAAIARGIGMVHQHFMLIPSFTVAENITIGYEPGLYGYFDYKKAERIANELARKYSFNINANDIVADLSVGLKQKVEILKVLNHGAQILILDEPTAVLTPQETIELFEQLRVLRDEGHTIIFISHKLREVKQISDRISVMRKGKLVETFANTGSITEKHISESMIGHEISAEWIQKKHAGDAPPETVLAVKDLCYVNENGKMVLHNVSFSVSKGEIVGVAGVEGNGQNELARIMGAMLRPSAGSIALNGRELGRMSIAEIRNLGMVYVPADRMQYGVAGPACLWENVISTRYRDDTIFRHGFLQKGNAKKLTEQLMLEYDIVAKSPMQETGMLSGGNIQKVVVAREFSFKPLLIIAEQPTRGIDIGSADMIHRKLIELRDAGCMIFIISADLDEILKISDRILVMYNGSIAGEFNDPAHFDETELGEYMLGVRGQK